MTSQLQQFAPVGLLFIMAAVFAVGNILLPTWIGKKRAYGEVKDTPYECGMPPASEPHARFSVKFYLVAMLFIAFDLEVVFVVSWAEVYRDLIKPVSEGGLGSLMFWGMFFFVGLLELGHFYVWKQGALTWAPRPGRARAGGPAR